MIPGCGTLAPDQASNLRLSRRSRDLRAPGSAAPRARASPSGPPAAKVPGAPTPPRDGAPSGRQVRTRHPARHPAGPGAAQNCCGASRESKASLFGWDPLPGGSITNLLFQMRSVPSGEKTFGTLRTRNLPGLRILPRRSGGGHEADHSLTPPPFQLSVFRSGLLSARRIAPALCEHRSPVFPASLRCSLLSSVRSLPAPIPSLQAKPVPR